MIGGIIENPNLLCPQMKLNDQKCKNAKPKDKSYKLFDGGGLYLEVKPTGGKQWRLKYRFGGKEKRLSFGAYPIIGLKDARIKRDNAKLILENDNDPAVVKQEEKISKQVDSANTFESIAREWIEKRKGEIEEKTLLNIQNRLERNLFPQIGKLPIKSVTAPVLLNALKEIEARGVLDTVKRTRQTAGQIFRFAIASGRADYNPSQDISEALKINEVKSFKSMPLAELPNFLRKVNSNDARLFKQTCLALRLMVLTFTRKKELSHAKWEEFDLENKMWLIPASRMKMKKEHYVPLSSQALEILQELKEMNGSLEYVFPSLHKPRQPMHEDTILRALYKLGHKGTATIHGFRALAMTTIMEELGYRYEVPNLQLAHSKGDAIRKAYDRTEFMPERTKMMQEWADYVDSIVAGNVIKAKFGDAA
jgi:integrase